MDQLAAVYSWACAARTLGRSDPKNHWGQRHASRERELDLTCLHVRHLKRLGAPVAKWNVILCVMHLVVSLLVITLGGLTD